MRRSAASQRLCAVGVVAGVGGDAGQAHRGRRPRRGRRRCCRASSRIATRRASAPATRSVGVHRREQALAERGLLPAAGGAVPRGRGFERRPRSRVLSRVRGARARGAPGRAPPCARRRSPRPSRSRARGWRRRSRSRRPGTAPVRDSRPGTPPSAGSPSRREVSAARPRWTTASSNRCWIRASSPSTASRRTWSHGSSTIREPVLDLIARLDAALLVAGGDRGPGGEEPVRGLVPRPVHALVERVAAIGELHRVRGTRRDATRRRRGSSCTAPAGRRRRSRRRARSRRRCGRGRARGDPVDASIHAASSSASARSAVGSRAAGGIERGQDPLRAAAVAEHDPRPAEPVRRCRARAVVRARRSTPARRRCWRARLGRTTR